MMMHKRPHFAALCKHHCQSTCFFVAAVFMIADGHFWNGIVFIGAGTSLSSAAAIHKKKNDASDRDQEMK